MTARAEQRWGGGGPESYLPLRQVLEAGHGCQAADDPVEFRVLRDLRGEGGRPVQNQDASAEQQQLPHQLFSDGHFWRAVRQRQPLHFQKSGVKSLTFRMKKRSKVKLMRSKAALCDIAGCV